MTNPRRPDWLTPWIAHRGLHDAATGLVENSRAAIRAAVEAGYGVEFDVQVSRDGEAMVFHDADLDRLTEESGPLAERDSAELTRIRLSGTDETIPTLAEILAITGERALALVEIKDRFETYERADGRLEPRVAALLAAHRGPAAAMSFNPHALASLREGAPNTPRGLVSCLFEDAPHLPLERREALASLEDLRRIGASFLSYDLTALPNPWVDDARAEGLAVICWTAHTPEEAEHGFRCADAVTFSGFRPPPRRDGG